MFEQLCEKCIEECKNIEKVRKLFDPPRCIQCGCKVLKNGHWGSDLTNGAKSFSDFEKQGDGVLDLVLSTTRRKEFTLTRPVEDLVQYCVDSGITIPADWF